MSGSVNSAAGIPVEHLHVPHPRIRANDWRSPLVARLLQTTVYTDGSKTVEVSYRDRKGVVVEGKESLTWAGMKDDFDKCMNTYQAPVLTEFAALGIACILCTEQNLEITEVTRRGEKVDYWLGDREELLEVSGTTSDDLEELCERKAKEQLMQNPMGKSGFVCAAAFHENSARLWYYQTVRAT